MPTHAPPNPDATVLTRQDRSWGVIAHLSAIIAAVLSAGWLSLIGPLVVYLLKKDRPGVRATAAGAFNFNLAFWVVYLISWGLIFTLVGAVVGIPLLIIAFLVSVWCHLRGAIASYHGRPYTYPFQLKVLR
ncbi:MAG: DUF4870 domain-containing protein [Allobranchiibius sp.]